MRTQDSSLTPEGLTDDQRLPEIYPGQGIPSITDYNVIFCMLRLDMNENISFLAKIAFFCVGLFWSRELMAVSDSWDYVVVNMLTIISGLGICMVFAMWTIQVRARRAAAQENLPANQTSSSAHKC